MAQKDLIIKEKLDYSGIFSFSGFYGFAHGWLKYEEYTVTEDEYSESVSGNSRNLTIKWKATKKISDYFKIELSLKFEVGGLTEVEVEIDGQKKNMNKGKLKIEMKGTLVKDPNSNWETTPFNKFIRGIYDKYIIPQRLEDMEEKTSGDLRSYKEDMKKYLEASGKR